MCLFLRYFTKSVTLFSPIIQKVTESVEIISRKRGMMWMEGKAQKHMEVGLDSRRDAWLGFTFSGLGLGVQAKFNLISLCSRLQVTSGLCQQLPFLPSL